MALQNESFRQALIWLWFRLSTIFAAGLLLALALLYIPGKVSGWLFYLTFAEASYEFGIRIVAVGVFSVLLGGFCASVTAPFLKTPAFRTRAALSAVRIASAAAVFVDLLVVLSVMAEWAYLSRRSQAALFGALILGLAICLSNADGRRLLTSRFDGLLAPRTTFRAMLAIAAGVAAVFIMGRTGPPSVRAQHNLERPHPNLLLITFDALSAEDMSVYGYRLPTTPRIAEFASKASVFTNFFSASTFTTPGIAALMTGLAPSESGVYHLPGHLRDRRAAQTLPHMLHDSGYATAAVIASPMAYFFTAYQSRDFDVLEGPVYSTHGERKVWDATSTLHPQQTFGDHLSEFQDFGSILRPPPPLVGLAAKFSRQTKSEFPAAEVFARAREVIRSLPEGYFLWIHVMAPHYPYLPGANLGRFLPTQEMRTAEQQLGFAHGPTYTPELQRLVNQDRLRYDEFVADADGAFGDFMSGLESEGKLADTAVIVSSDHGESFEGGVLMHEHPYQTRPEIHIPLIVRLPGQDSETRVAFTADQTSLAPTILEIAHLPRASWLRGPSLAQWLSPDAGGPAESAGAVHGAAAERGLAFTEFLETNSIFRPLNAGTAGVTDGVHQYVYDLATREGALRNMAEPILWNIDRSQAEPEAARELRDALHARFPELFKK